MAFYHGISNDHVLWHNRIIVPCFAGWGSPLCYEIFLILKLFMVKQDHFFVCDKWFWDGVKHLKTKNAFMPPFTCQELLQH
ncbi:hypothetical protein CEV08_07275 [Bartonella tribocorum]|uniref:Uncharacterized protein n=1 Tax=Bartonella tribocorum TaxID=85701 RepID=A0A2M6URS5_9HYPH|nr:hypothetical protein CEV08_07275 [Bartonella tribocorum]